MEGNPLNYTWTQSGSHTWQRRPDEVEIYWAKRAKLYDFQGRRPFAITFHLSIEVGTSGVSRKDVIIALKKAWCNIRYDHPSIASRVIYEQNRKSFIKVYSSLKNDEEIADWVAETVIEISSGQNGVDFANSDPPAPDLPTMFILNRFQDKSQGGDKQKIDIDIVFRAPHETIDGIGTMLLFANFLTHTSNALERGVDYKIPVFNNREIENLSPSYRIAARVPDIPTVIQREKINKMHVEHPHVAKAVSSRSLQRSLSVPCGKSAQLPDRHQRTEIKFDQITTKALLTACKANRVSVTHAFHAIIPIALLNYVKQSPTEQRLCYTLTLLCNLRAFCEKPFNTRKHPVTAYHTGSTQVHDVEVVSPPAGKIATEKEKNDEFFRILRETRDFYQRVTHDPDIQYTAPYLFRAMAQNTPEVPQYPEPCPPPKPNPTVSISSLGNLDNILPSEFGDIKVFHPWVTGEEMGNGYGLFLLTHRGELNLGAAYNAAWHEEPEVKNFLRICVNELFAFFGILDQL